MARTFGTTATLTAFLLLTILFPRALCSVFDITKYGAKADGQSDATQGLMAAWKEACAVPGSKVVIPGGKYVMGQVSILGPCQGPITLQVDGTILAPMDAGQLHGDYWFSFRNIDGFTMSGKGVFDGQGSNSWEENQCAKTKSCSSLPTNIRLDFLTNSLVDGITSLNSKMFHFNVLGCKNITLNRVTITAPEDSANTDGIHIGRSDGVTIIGPTIKTGDDCISLGDGSKNVNISGVNCGPGHGIAVGSLGKFNNEEPVVGVTVRNCTLTKTMWGVRVKTWPASPAGTASDMHFEDITMNDVSNPVLIDQTYCPNNQCTLSSPSKVKISQVSFKGIRGTSATKDVVRLICSSAVPCDEVEVGDITVQYTGPDGPTAAICTNVRPNILGDVPPGC